MGSINVTSYSGEPYPFDPALDPIPGPAVQWYLQVRERLEARGLRVTPIGRSRASEASVLDMESFVIRCPVPGCAGLATLYWDNRRANATRGRQKAPRLVMAAGLTSCATSGTFEMQRRPRHTETEMLAALGDDLAPFAPVPVVQPVR